MCTFYLDVGRLAFVYLTILLCKIVEFRNTWCRFYSRLHLFTFSVYPLAFNNVDGAEQIIRRDTPCVTSTNKKFAFRCFLVFWGERAVGIGFKYLHSEIESKVEFSILKIMKIKVTKFEICCPTSTRQWVLYFFFVRDMLMNRYD